MMLKVYTGAFKCIISEVQIVFSQIVATLKINRNFLMKSLLNISLLIIMIFLDTSTDDNWYGARLPEFGRLE